MDTPISRTRSRRPWQSWRNWRMAGYSFALWMPLLWVNSAVLAFWGMDNVPSRYDHQPFSSWIFVDWFITGSMVCSQAALGFFVSESLQRREEDRRASDEQRFAFLGRIAASVAHEMRNPLHNLRLLSERLRDRQMTGDPATIAKIDANIDRLEHAVQLALELARPPLDQSDDPPSCNLQAVVSVVATENQAKTPHAQLSVAMPDHPLPVIGRELSIFTAVDNVVRNALTSANGGAVTLSVDATDTVTTVTVINPGRLPDHRDANGIPIVSGFGGGFGIGLGITRHLVTGAGGSIQLRQDGERVVTKLQFLSRQVPHEQ